MALQAGLIGLKGHTGVLLGSIPNMEDVRLAAVCADDDEAAYEAVSGWPASDDDTRTFTDYAKMLDEIAIDVVGICGTDADRAPAIIAALQRNIHVIAEKPFAMNLEQLANVQETLAGADAHLSMMLTMRFEAAYLTMRRLIADGAVGDVCLATMQKSYRLGDRPEWQRNSDTFSGIIPFIGIHALDLIGYTTGRSFLEGVAYCANTGHPEIRDMEDNACIALQLDNGGSAAVRLDYCRPAAAPTHGDDRLRIAGNDGVIEAPGGGEQVTLITHDEEPREVELAPTIDQFADFLDSIYGDGECLAPADECIRVSDLCLRLRNAANTGRAVDFG